MAEHPFLRAIAEGLLTGSLAVRPSGFALPPRTAAPVALPTQLQRLRQTGQPTQAQRESLYEHPVDFRQDMEASPTGVPRRALDDRNLAFRFWNAQRKFNAAQPPPRNRLNSYAPLGFIGLAPWLDDR
jgi:hypothetical protein